VQSHALAIDARYYRPMPNAQGGVLCASAGLMAGLFRVLCVLPADYRLISKLIRVWNVERVTASSCDIGEAPLSAAQTSM